VTKATKFRKHPKSRLSLLNANKQRTIATVIRCLFQKTDKTSQTLVTILQPVADSGSCCARPLTTDAHIPSDGTDTAEVLHCLKIFLCANAHAPKMHWLPFFDPKCNPVHRHPRSTDTLSFRPRKRQCRHVNHRDFRYTTFRQVAIRAYKITVFDRRCRTLD
jgi:hypothetical protein